MVILRRWLAENTLQVGDRLPPERDFAEILSISRPELRKALAILEAEGQIERRIGSGTFISKTSQTIHSAFALSELTNRTGPHDAMIARLSFEPELAHLAALHATPMQIKKLKQLSGDIRAVSTWQEYEALDFALHDLVAQSTGNMLLNELHKIMNFVRQVVVWRTLSSGEIGPTPTYHSFDEHDAIVTAIANRDRPGARKAMRAHLLSTLNAMTLGNAVGNEDYND